jgi:V8-like Glu-specific endopeptidase
LLLLVLLFTAMVILSACAGAPAATEAPAAPEEPAAPAATEPPLEPDEPSEQYPVQYGQDTRTELFQHSDAKLKELAASVAIFVHKNQVKRSGKMIALDGYTLNEMSEMGWLVNGANVPMCIDELFSTQPAPGFCTGFLVAEDILVTAGHCLQKTACTDTNIVFGFQMTSAGSLAEISKENVFECAQVIQQALPTRENGYLDYAILKLDRPTGRPGLLFSSEDLLVAQDNVAVLGYPSGLPQKIASNAYVLSNDTSNPFFVANLDTFGSNSGSPVINTETYQVEGILVRGTTDYVLSQDGACVQVNRCPEDGDVNCAGENATKMAMLANAIPRRGSAGPNCFPGTLLILVLLALARLKTG